MAEFEPIETQEALDEIVQKRLDKERKKYDGWMSPSDVDEKYKGWKSPDDVIKQYEGWMSPDDAAEKYKDYLSPEDAAKKDAEIKSKELSLTKSKVAYEVGLPHELADRLSGDTEEEIRKDAENFSKYMKKGAPLSSTEPSNSNGKSTQRAELTKMLNSMKGE